LLVYRETMHQVGYIISLSSSNQGKEP